MTTMPMERPWLYLDAREIPIARRCPAVPKHDSTKNMMPLHPSYAPDNMYVMRTHGHLDNTGHDRRRRHQCLRKDDNGEGRV